MKIVHICLGGGWYEKNAYQDQLLPRYHRRLGHEVTVVASYYGRWNLGKNCYDLDKTREVILTDGIKLVRIKPFFPLKINAHVNLFCGLKRVIEKEKPDLIFLHGLVCLNYIQIAKYKKHNNNVKIVCDNHADWNNSLHHWSTRLWSKIVIRRWLVKKLIPITECFYGVTPLRCDFLIKEYGVPRSKVKLLVLGADDDSMRLESRGEIRKTIREKNGITNDDFLVVSGGRINMKKSDYFLSLATAINNIDEKNLKLLIFGPVANNVVPLFKKFDSSRILLAGEVAANRVYDFFFASDIVVFPGLHSVMWEQAVASKVPCVFHRIEGFDHVDFGGNCLWVDEDTHEQYQRVIERILNDGETYKSMYLKATSCGAEKFLYSKIAEKVIDDVYKQK